MSQFTNNWNGQNGMMNNTGPMQTAGYPSSAWMPTGNPSGGAVNQNIGVPGSMVNQPSMPVPNTQGWKTYDAPQIRPIAGRFVNSFEEIKPQEVPMDGGMYFFPSFDYSCIYAKYWDNNGQLMSFRFMPEKTDNQSVQQQQTMSIEMNDILKGYENISMNVVDRLDAIDKRDKHFENILTDILAAVQTKPTRAKASNTNDKEEK